MITKAALLEDLGRAGIDPHGMLLCHFSMKKIGPVENGADTVLDALMEYMKNGLLIVPCHTWAMSTMKTPCLTCGKQSPASGFCRTCSGGGRAWCGRCTPRIRCAFTGPGHRRLQKGRSGSIRPVRPAPVTASCCGKMRR